MYNCLPLLSLDVRGPQLRKSRVNVIVIVTDTNMYNVSGGIGQCFFLNNRLHVPDVALIFAAAEQVCGAFCVNIKSK